MMNLKLFTTVKILCIWVFKSRSERNKFMDETEGMKKKDREDHYSNFYQ